MGTARRGFAIVDGCALVIVVLAGLALLALAGRGGRGWERSLSSADRLATLSRAISHYTVDVRTYPPSYVIGDAPTGITWKLSEQSSPTTNIINGRIHWSGLLTGLGYSQSATVFTSDSVLRGGAPNSNPGPKAVDWEPGQLNEMGASAPAGTPNDRQAKRVAFTANGAIMGRNRFVDTGQFNRYSRFMDYQNGRGAFGTSSGATKKNDSDADAAVGPDIIKDPSSTILLTEFLVLPSGGWSSLADGAAISRSHRPVTPFLGVSTGTSVYNEPNTGTLPHFRYPLASEILPTGSLGAGVFVNGACELNAVARHHPGDTAYFAFVDGHVTLTTVQDTVQRRWWGDRFYTITGDNRVVP